jgi:predicted dehydrogenase
MKVLVIGCGNIGGLYDVHQPDKVWTHARAFSQITSAEISFYDEDPDKSADMASMYGGRSLEKIGKGYYTHYDIVSITSPTPTHYGYLHDLLFESVPVIICEKPVVNTLDEVEHIRNQYNSSTSKVLVNYLRRFQPAYQLARERLSKMPAGSFRGILVKYKRGFLNNGGHAVDLIEFLLGHPVAFTDFVVHYACFDAFPDDPTISGGGTYLGQPILFSGLSEVDYAVFEVEIFYSQAKVVICHSGNEIRYYMLTQDGNLAEDRKSRQENILDQYMVSVVNEAESLFTKSKHEDNFMSALRVNEELLKIIKRIKEEGCLN